ncbi:hypothetical protein ACFQS3_19335 [Glycomyces mayteni]|uniref:Uncharacterized protein n=1 Tax=Glycomyces mayteni TaxID=543887 RepID=A0ABW2DAY2_9ACTN|nr:hypothetical protein GCM10025732_03500 [Glycomyces mayteni]
MAKLRITDYLTELKTEAAGLRSVCEPGMLDRVAPSRPDTTVAGILLDLVRLYRWTVDALFAPPSEDRDVPEPPRPQAAGTAVLDLFDQSLAAVLDAVEARGPESPAWTWAPVEWRAEFCTGAPPSRPGWPGGTSRWPSGRPRPCRWRSRRTR